MRVGSLKMAIFASFLHCLPNILHTWPHDCCQVIRLSMTFMGVFRGDPQSPQKLSFYHDEGSTGDTSLAAMPSALDTKARRLNFVQ